MTVRFLILMPWGRVGSNLVMAVLRQSAKDMSLANETLNKVSGAEPQMISLKAFYFTDPIMPETHIGGKQSVRAIADLKGVAAWLVANDIRVVRLRRDNIVKTAISQMRAELYAKQSEQEAGKPAWGVRPGNTPLGPTEIDIAGLERRLRMISDANTQLLGAFSSLNVLDLEYEQINNDLDATIKKLRDYLELPQVSFRTPFIKATPDDLSEVVLNIDAVREKLAGTKFASMI